MNTSTIFTIHVCYPIIGFRGIPWDNLTQTEKAEAEAAWMAMHGGGDGQAIKQICDGFRGTRISGVASSLDAAKKAMREDIKDLLMGRNFVLGDVSEAVYKQGGGGHSCKGPPVYYKNGDGPSAKVTIRGINDVAFCMIYFEVS